MTIISIITPSYNQKDLLQRCIASVRDQVSEDLIIFHHIQDGGSTDGTSEWLSDNERFFTVDGGYHFSYKVEKDDILFEQTIIDKTSLDIIAGSVVDFKKEMIGESFTISNPKASASCGCGLSFSV